MADEEHEDHVAAGQDVSPEPAPPPQPSEPIAGREVTPEPGQEPPMVPEEPQAPPEPAEPAEPGIYVYESEEDFGIHPVLGRLTQGENDFSEETHPDKLQAIGDLVAAGVLKKA
jgi:hypothetical protein